MNLASALIYRVLEEKDFDTWMNVRRQYLPPEYHSLYQVIEKHAEKYYKLPTLEDLKLEVRDSNTLDKVYALEDTDTDVEPYLLLEYLKNEYAQKEALGELEKWIDNSIAFETAEEVVRHIQKIGVELEQRVELIDAQESMQKIHLFDSDEEMENRVTLGFNEDFDRRFTFRPTDYIMMGGERGHGKSITGSNICRHIIDTTGKKALYFSVEMVAREVLQRDASIATGIPLWKIKDRSLDVIEWQKLAAWWAGRYNEGEVAYQSYLDHRSFDKFHQAISRHSLKPAHLDIVYNADMTLGQIVAEVDKRKMLGEKIGIIVVDYVQVVKRTGGMSGINSIDWTEQISVSRGLKDLALRTEIPVYSPYQIDKAGEARFARGILDAADAAFTLKAYKKVDQPCMLFNTTKMRNADDTEYFCSSTNWQTLKIGPKSVPVPEVEPAKKGGFSSKALEIKTAGIYE